MEAQHAKASGSATTEIISFEVRDQAFGIDIGSVREIRGWTPVTPLPQAQEYVCGVVNLRGNVLPILDLGSRLGFGQTTPTVRHAIVVVQVGSQEIGLLVDGVNEIVSASSSELRPVPDLGADIAAE